MKSGPDIPYFVLERGLILHHSNMLLMVKVYRQDEMGEKTGKQKWN